MVKIVEVFGTRRRMAVVLAYMGVMFVLCAFARVATPGYHDLDFSLHNFLDGAVLMCYALGIVYPVAYYFGKYQVLDALEKERLKNGA